MKRGREYHKTHDDTEQYSGYNVETGEKFEGVFMTAAQAEQKRADGYAVAQCERIPRGLA